MATLVQLFFADLCSPLCSFTSFHEFCTPGTQSSECMETLLGEFAFKIEIGMSRDSQAGLFMWGPGQMPSYLTQMPDPLGLRGRQACHSL